MRASLIAIAALCLTATPALSQDVQRMDQIAQTRFQSGEFMGSVIVAKDGQPLFEKGYGFANLEWQNPNDGETRFRLASLTKQFTAVALLLLEERGKLRLDDPVGKYMTDAPAAWAKVTIRHLLNHTAGIPNFTSFPDFRPNAAKAATIPEILARFRDMPLEFEPGSKMSYSNSGYVVATAVLETVSGQPYASFVAENLFKPLGMEHSGFDSHAAIIPHRASGYTPTAAGVRHADFISMTLPQGAGSLFSTTRDLVKWNAGIYGGKLINASSMQSFLTVGHNHYALGILVHREVGKATYSHSGGIEGFNTWLGYDPDRKITVSVLANINGPAADQLGAQFMALARGEKVILPSERTAVDLPAKELRDYPGVYAVTPSFSMEVRLEDGKLVVQATGQPANPVFAEKKDHFFLRATEADIFFLRNASGKVDRLMLHQGGQKIEAKRQ